MTDKVGERVLAGAVVASAERPRRDLHGYRPMGALVRLRREHGVERPSGLDVLEDWVPRDERPAPFDIPLRPIFILVEVFRAQCRQAARPRRLGAVLGATIRLARQCLAQADALCHRDAMLGADNERCLHDLEALLRTLVDDDPPPPPDLLHAMDALIVQLVRIDALAAEAADG